MIEAVEAFFDGDLEGFQVLCVGDAAADLRVLAGFLDDLTGG